MKVLLSIHPEYAEQILDGRKKFEFRRGIFKRKDVDTVVIYATRPVGKIVGEFQIGRIINEKPSKLWQTTKDFAGITRQALMAYFDGKEKGFAIGVKNPKRYPDPLDLKAVSGSSIAPQSFRYLR